MVWIMSGLLNMVRKRLCSHNGINLNNCIVFVPIIFVEGMTGKIFKEMGPDYYFFPHGLFACGYNILAHDGI